MNSMQAEKNSEQTVTTAPAAAVEQIRDLLFGTQIRDYEIHFARLEDTLAREVADIRDMVRRRLDAMESSFKKEADGLNVRLQAEENARRDLAKDSARELKGATDALSNKMTELEHSTSRANSEIRDKQAAESSKMHEELQRIHAELTALLNEQAGQLRHNKVDRVMLGSLLNEVVKKISDGDSNGNSAGAL